VKGAAKAVVGADIEVVMPLGGLIDPATEKTRIEKDIAKAQKEIGGLEKKLGNPDFVSRAPEEVVAEIRQRLDDEKARLQRLLDAITTLESQ
jgi:valyl-tRNA synthetase